MGVKILVLGGNGFIARSVIVKCLAAGHEVVAAIRQKHHLWQQAHANLSLVQANFLKDKTQDSWLPHLQGVDVVINCVGVFQTPTSKEIWQIHCHTPEQIYRAAVQAGVKQVIHLSALGVDKSDVPYAASKYQCEQKLAELSIDSTVWRPSFVYGAGSYAGSSLFRGLAGLPFVIPLPGKAEQRLQPIHIDDLSSMIVGAIGKPGKHVLVAAGPEKQSLKMVLNKIRGWLGFKPALNLTVPLPLIRVSSWFGNWIYNSPLSSTGVKMMQMDNVATDEQYQIMEQNTEVKPRSFEEGLFADVSHVQDRWHARLYFLRPILRIALALFWIWSGMTNWFFSQFGMAITTLAGVEPVTQAWLTWGFGGVQVILGLFVLVGWRLRLVGGLQCFIILLTTIMASILPLNLWANPFQPMAKNVVLLLATLVMMALDKSR